jgi:hypothetical protein
VESKKFDAIVDSRIEKIKKVLTTKAEEYARGDRLHNFKAAALVDGETPERALWGMYKKHLISVRDLIKDVDEGKTPQKKLFDEKIGDSINYHILLEALLLERAGKKIETDLGTPENFCKIDNKTFCPNEIRNSCDSSRKTICSGAEFTMAKNSAVYFQKYVKPLLKKELTVEDLKEINKKLKPLLF